MSWIVLNSGAGDPAFNMAMDDALLVHAAETGTPVLRFYGWNGPAATFGYFQRYDEIERLTRLRPLIRRPTGGGLVPHHDDWTYSLVVPSGHEWHRLKAEESYHRMHRWIQSALKRVGIETELANCCRKELPGQCFVGYEKHDVLRDGRKIAGAAQRRNKQGLLIQGSMQPVPSGVRLDQFVSAMCASGIERFGSIARVGSSNHLDGHVRELVAARYGRHDYNRRR